MSGEYDGTAGDRVAEAAEQRRRLRATLDGDTAEMSLTEVLVGAAERRSIVTLVAVSSTIHRVRIDRVGDDVVVAGTDGGRTVILGSDAVRIIVVHGRTPPTGPARRHRTADDTMGFGYDAGSEGNGCSMADILSDLLASEPHISVGSGAEQLSGTLVGVGSDVAVLATDAGETAYVRLDSTTEISVAVSDPASSSL